MADWSRDFEDTAAAARRVGVELTPAGCAKLSAYAARLLAANHLLHLVSKGDEEHLFDRHLMEAISIAPLLESLFRQESVEQPLLADIGSGGGLPGIPLAIALPRIRVVLIERSANKATFLHQVVVELKLTGVDVVCEDARSAPVEGVDAVVSRAVGGPARLWKLARPMLIEGGRMLAMDRRRRTSGPVDKPDDRPQEISLTDYAGGEIESRTWLESGRKMQEHGVLVVRKVRL
ncbi:MAG: 16S rRNA (guanine(527)-N(7))-methyltransferase RsmG [Pseudomonadales bacterium]|nr:16S rRNA (guanine(527)-N(7))-methyltransferase RsmG [Pseudomonadales bacterium]MDP6471419.1 16S rRNA (guanine(527)-N(7))-methyltransferase RsmG [Pseudomonadales bacterium]MDP6828588.1 16S rRNA (guanine(527)-N(7))-methyltransferase RsmG [Pseudomonadales bacterium]MDP6972012.1 16S rRNA (guanine(527)-N(7))-methyltransferase RsmG [Pseudomonadales bacterium]